MTTNTIASIDVGSHTARLLIAEKRDASPALLPLVRKRAYIHLAEDFDPTLKVISNDGFSRAAAVLKKFSETIFAYNVQKVFAMATGVVRLAANRQSFFRRMAVQSGLNVVPISGEREAFLSAKGALGVLKVVKPPFFVFDLGGGTTEFFFNDGEKFQVKSLPLGAMGLTRSFISKNPPAPVEIENLGNYVDALLADNEIYFSSEGPVVGTGGTVVTLGALLKGISLNDPQLDRLNGIVCEASELENCVHRLLQMTIEERIFKAGLDAGRAPVIAAGGMVVTRLLRHLKTRKMTVSMSDLLEGVLMEFCEGEQHG